MDHAIQFATTNHIPELLEFQKRAVVYEERLGAPKNLFRTYSLEELQNAIANRSAYVIQASDSSIVGAFYLMSLSANKVSVYCMNAFFVREEFRGQGIGSNAFQFVLSALENSSVSGLSAIVNVKNARAQKFYISHGLEKSNVAHVLYPQHSKHICSYSRRF